MGFTLYGILSALAMAAMLGVTALAGRKRGLTYSRFIRFAVLAIPLSFLLSRAVYCLATLSYYTETIEQPAMMLQVHDGGYAMLGAMLGVLLAALLSAKWTKLPAADLLDALALGMPCALIIARLAEPLSSMRLTEIGWGQEHASPLFAFLDEICEGRHPVFAYEAIAAVVMLIALLFIRRNARRGDVFWAFLLLFGCSQSVLESMFSTTKHMMFLFVHITQVAALIMALIPLVVWSRRIPRPDRAAKLRLAAAWTLAIACIASALVEEIKVTGADRVEAIKPFVPVVLAAGVGFFCVMWRREGLLRLLPVIAAGVIAIAAVIIDQTPLVGDHFLLVLWGVMALDMFMLCWTGLRLRAAAEHNDPDCED